MKDFICVQFDDKSASQVGHLLSQHSVNDLAAVKALLDDFQKLFFDSVMTYCAMFQDHTGIVKLRPTA